MKNPDTLDDFLNQITFANASALARAGRYTEAESFLLERINTQEADLQTLDLMARIRAQQGRLSEAEELWKRALALDPLNELCLTGLRRISSLQRPFLITYGKRLVFLFILILIILSGNIAIWKMLDNRIIAESNSAKKAAAAQNIALVDLSELIESQEAIILNLQEITTGIGENLKIDNEIDNQPAFVSIPDIHISTPEITSKKESDILTISFEEGLFRRGIEFKPKAQEALDTIGPLLASLSTHVSIRVTGYTDDIKVSPNSIYLDNDDLGFYRALAVVSYLRKKNSISSMNISLDSKGSDLAPYANDTHDNRMRNRTVIIRISPLSADYPG